MTQVISRIVPTNKRMQAARRSAQPLGAREVVVDASEAFVRGVWCLIPDEDDTSWVRAGAELPGTDAPLGDYGPLLRKMLDAGISERDIARFARVMAYQTAFNLCYHLGDPASSYEGPGAPPAKWEWELYEVRAGKPVDPMSCVHELLLTADPTGREMRPRADT